MRTKQLRQKNEEITERAPKGLFSCILIYIHILYYILVGELHFLHPNNFIHFKPLRDLQKPIWAICCNLSASFSGRKVSGDRWALPLVWS